MEKPRVVITGIGALTPIGNTVDEYWQGLCEGRNGIGRISRFDEPGLTSQVAGELKGFTAADHMEPKDVKRTDRFVHYAMASAGEAIRSAQIDMDRIDRNRFGVIYGSGIGGLETFATQHGIMMAKGVKRVSPFFIPMLIIDMAAGYLSMAFGLKGPNFGVVTACASGSHAIGEAYRALLYGDADMMLTGGAESTITPVGFAGFCSSRALSCRNNDPEHASRPFDKERDGFVMAEGSGSLILETLEHAQQRNAPIFGELVGYGSSGDAHHMTAPAPDGEGAARAMNAALKDAGIGPADVDYINAHGTSTVLNDKYETMAIKTVMGDRAHEVAISSTKSMTGHLLGATGAVELIACTRAIQNSIVPPTINYEVPDPECDLSYTPNEKVSREIDIALSNSLGFGGHNVTLIVKKYTA